MDYFERKIPTVKIVFDDKEFEFDTLTRFTTKLENSPTHVPQETYYFRVAGINREFLIKFKSDTIKSIDIFHSAKDENGSPFAFVDTLIYPIVKIDQSLFTTSGEHGYFDFTIYR